MADITLHKFYADQFKTHNSQSKSIQLIISSELRTLLSKAKTENKFVKRLLSPIKIKAAYIVSNNANYLDISCDSNGSVMLSYYTPELIQKIARKNLSSIERFNVPASWLMDPRRNFPKEITTPGRILGKIFDTVSNKEAEEFSTIFKTLNLDDSINEQFKEVSGDKVRYYYNEFSYSGNDSEASTLHKSCMRYSTLNVYMDLYAKNPESVSLLILPDEKGRIKGRAVLWKSNGKKYIDRIYYDSYSTYTMFVKYCRIKGIENISERNSSFNVISNRNTFNVKLQNWKLQYYPYTDTLTWLDMKTGTLHMELPDIKKASLLDYIYKVIPDIHKKNDEVIRNTQQLIDSGLRGGYINESSHLSDEDLVFFHIQSTGGKGNHIKKYTKQGQSLVWLGNYYSAYLPSEYVITGAINNDAPSPDWHCVTKLLLTPEKEPEAVRFNVHINNAKKEYLLPLTVTTKKTDNILIFQGFNESNNAHYYGNIHTIAKQEDCVYNRAFSYPFYKHQCIKMDENDEESWIPELLYKNEIAKPLYDALYHKAKTGKVCTEEESIELLWSLFRLHIGDILLARNSITKDTIAQRYKAKTLSSLTQVNSYMMAYIQDTISRNVYNLIREKHKNDSGETIQSEHYTLLSNSVHLYFIAQNSKPSDQRSNRALHVYRVSIGDFNVYFNSDIFNVLSLNTSREVPSYITF